VARNTSADTSVGGAGGLGSAASATVASASAASQTAARRARCGAGGFGMVNPGAVLGRPVYAISLRRHVLPQSIGALTFLLHRRRAAVR